MADKSFQIEFEVERPTKNTIRFKEKTMNGQPPKIDTLYVQKWALPEDVKRLKVTVEVFEQTPATK